MKDNMTSQTRAKITDRIMRLRDKMDDDDRSTIRHAVLLAITEYRESARLSEVPRTRDYFTELAEKCEIIANGLEP